MRGMEDYHVGLYTSAKEMDARAHTQLLGSDKRASRRSSRSSALSSPRSRAISSWCAVWRPLPLVLHPIYSAPLTYPE
ncbi:unnamed protein product [Danaus chrysippus]|uniref:(African queen) hypothetical protein n=1 Tax=Danaus chrysippus TaxID=151541 RepID=A0A8J2QDV5_9NEOP|nr:unnamed protein product [Danaus chrysippus]